MCAQALLGLAFLEHYRDPEPIKTTWFGNDWVTAVLAVPLLVAGLVRAVRGFARGLLLWLGMIAYAVYNYAFYLFGAALNVFFLLYVLTMVVAVVALILALSRLDVAAVARSFRLATPVRAIGGSLTYWHRAGVGLDRDVGCARFRRPAHARRPGSVQDRRGPRSGVDGASTHGRRHPALATEAVGLGDRVAR
jgi:hypothetical protein